MKKSWAIEALGGTAADAARAIGVSQAAVAQWPEDLPARLGDRVQAALARRLLPPELIGADGAPALAESKEAA